MTAAELRALAIKNNPDAIVLEDIQKILVVAAGNGKFEYRHFPDALPDYVIKELKKFGFKVSVQKGEYNTTDTTISWD